MSDHDDRQVWMRDKYTDALLSDEGPQDHGGSPRRNQILVGILLARSYADWETGIDARPSVDTIASRLGLSANPVRAALHALTEQGWLIAEARPNRPTSYHMNIPPKPSDSTLLILRSSDSTVLKMKTSESTPQNLHKRASDSEVEGFRNEGAGPQNLKPNYNQEHISRTAAADAREQEAALLQDDPTGLGWEQLEVEVFDQLNALYRGKAALETAQRFISTCKAFKHLCPAFNSPQGVLDFLADQRSYWASAKASEKNYPKTAHDFAIWTAKQSAIEAYAARVTPAHAPVKDHADKAFEEQWRVDALKGKIRRLVETWINERPSYYGAVTSLWMAAHTPYPPEAHVLHDAMCALMEETGLSEEELRRDPPWKRSWRDDLEKAAAKELGIESWEVTL
jgi:hypothetical protein